MVIPSWPMSPSPPWPDLGEPEVSQPKRTLRPIDLAEVMKSGKTPIDRLAPRFPALNADLRRRLVTSLDDSAAVTFTPFGSSV